jgi:hypothetical protein
MWYVSGLKGLRDCCPSLALSETTRRSFENSQTRIGLKARHISSQSSILVDVSHSVAWTKD